MTSGNKRTLMVVLGIAISVALLWAVFHKISFSELVSALVHVNYLWLVPNILLMAFSMYQRAWRWGYMLKPIKVVEYDRLLSSTCIGFMANNVLPLRLGEFVRAYSLSRLDRDISKTASMATIFVERMVFDVVALLAIFGAIVGFSTLPIRETEIGRHIENGTWLAAAVAIAGLCFVLFMAIKPETAGRLIVKFLPRGFHGAIKAAVMRFSDGLRFMTSNATVWMVGIHTLLIWVCLGLSNYFVFLAFDFDLPISASYVLLVVVTISIMIPSSPGFVGVYHASAAYTLQLYGVPIDQAGAFALVLHAAQYLTITAMGFYYLKTRHLSLKKLEEEASVETG